MLSCIQIVEIQRLHETTGYTLRKIASIVGVSHQSVMRTIKRFAKLGMTGKKLSELEPEDVITLRYSNNHTRKNTSQVPEWAKIHAQKQKGLTRFFIYSRWKEESELNTMKYSTFCRKYRLFLKENNLYMKLSHNAGECVQGDFAGKTCKVAFSKKNIQFFLGVHAHSQRFYVLGTPDQTTDSWIAGFQHVFTESGGVPEIIVPDNPKAVVSVTGSNMRLNASFEAFAKHFNVTVIPARPGHPQDKALVELSVKIFTNNILPKLKKLTFQSLEELNQCLKIEVDAYNNKCFQSKASSRQQNLEAFDQPMLGELPEKDFNPYETSSDFTLAGNYHFMVDEHSYSAPYAYANKKVRLLVFKHTVELYREHKLIAEHKRSKAKGERTLIKEHMHPNHLWYEDKPKEFYEAWANDKYQDHSVSQLLASFFDSKYTASKRSNDRARKFMKMVEKYDDETVVKAAKYAISTGETQNIQMIELIFKSGIYQESSDTSTNVPGALLRGPEYFNNIGAQS